MSVVGSACDKNLKKIKNSMTTGVRSMNNGIPEDITNDKLHWLIENVEEMFAFQDDEDHDSS